MAEASPREASPSSAPGAIFGLHPGVEPGVATIHPGADALTAAARVAWPRRMFEELPFHRYGGPTPRSVHILRAVGFGSYALMLLSALTLRPRPGLHGDGRWVLLALVVFVVGALLVFPRRALPAGRRVGGLAAIGAATLVLMALQPPGPAIAGIYMVVILAALRLPDRVAVPLSALVIGGAVLVLALTAEHPGGAVVSLPTSVIPWFVVIRLLRTMQEGRARAEGLVEELRAARAAEAESATLAERGRVARDMHDVLAHSLSALALQLEAVRLLARDRGAEPEVVAGVERAHRLAADGLDEARRAVGALRGEELPGPERLEALTDTFSAHSSARISLAVTGKPRPLGAEAGVTLYRTAQEALTNVARHSAADRVEVRLDYEPERVVLTVEDHGPGAPVLATGPGAPGGGGYGLTGMRERAELLGGAFAAGPTPDGFRVALSVPA